MGNTFFDPSSHSLLEVIHSFEVDPQLLSL